MLESFQQFHIEVKLPTYDYYDIYVFMSRFFNTHLPF